MKKLALIVVLAVGGLLGLAPSKADAYWQRFYTGAYRAPYRNFGYGGYYGNPYRAYGGYYSPRLVYNYSPVVASFGYDPYWGLSYTYYPGLGYNIGGPTVNSSSTVFTPGFIGTQTQFRSPVRR